MTKVHLSIREQYKLAYRLHRMGVGANMNTLGMLHTFRSFGISDAVTDAAVISYIKGFTFIDDRYRWQDYGRYCDFQDGKAFVTQWITSGGDSTNVPHWLRDIPAATDEDTEPYPVNECRNCHALNSTIDGRCCFCYAPVSACSHEYTLTSVGVTGSTMHTCKHCGKQEYFPYGGFPAPSMIASDGRPPITPPFVS